MGKQLTVRLPDALVEFIDQQVEHGEATSRAAVVAAALDQQRRQEIADRDAAIPVSYTHLDVYKRQGQLYGQDFGHCQPLLPNKRTKETKASVHGQEGSVVGPDPGGQLGPGFVAAALQRVALAQAAPALADVVQLLEQGHQASGQDAGAEELGR